MKSKIEQLLKKLSLSTTEATSLSCIFALVLVILYIWMKVEQAKERERNRRGGRRNSNGVQRATQNTASYNARDEIQRLSARQRYLQSQTWENQCICLCLEQLIDDNQSNGSHVITFKNEEIVALLKQLAQKHRLYIIQLLPSDVIATLDNDKPSQQSQYELDVISLFTERGIIASGLPAYKILFCTTRKGKSSMVRQLMPTLYMDSDEAVIKELYPHLTEVVQINPLLAAGGVDPSVFVSNSVLAYFK